MKSTIKKLFLTGAMLVTFACTSTVERQTKNFEQATSFNTVTTEKGIKGIVLFEACGETPQAIASDIFKRVDRTTLISKTAGKGAVVGENTTQKPDWTLTATVNADEVNTLTDNLKALYRDKDCSATVLIGDYIKTWNREPSRTDPQGLWAGDLKYLKEGEFKNFRDFLVEIQPLYDRYGFENVARIINIEKVDLAAPIENLDVPDIATMTYIADFRAAFEAYRNDPRYQPLRDKRATTLDKYINFIGTLEPPEE